MNRQEVAMVLAKISIVDKRQVDTLTLDAWVELIGDLDVQDCLDAVAEHFRSSTVYLLPAHVRAGAAARAKARWARQSQDERLGIDATQLKPMPPQFKELLRSVGRPDGVS